MANSYKKLPNASTFGMTCIHWSFQKLYLNPQNENKRSSLPLASAPFPLKFSGPPSPSRAAARRLALLGGQHFDPWCNRSRTKSYRKDLSKHLCLPLSGNALFLGCQEDWFVQNGRTPNPIPEFVKVTREATIWHDLLD